MGTAVIGTVCVTRRSHFQKQKTGGSRTPAELVELVPKLIQRVVAKYHNVRGSVLREQTGSRRKNEIF
jgi:hypothetical protein